MDAPRSCLTVPGSSGKMLEKAVDLPADQVILDLEDSVAADAKDEARAMVLQALGDPRWGERVLSVRVNVVGTPAGRADLAALRTAPRVDTVVVPKVGAVEDVQTVVEELEGGVGVEALIETAGGLVACESIAIASPRVAALVFGPLDMGASVGVHSLDGLDAEGYPGDVWHAARFRILVAARAAGARAIDGPFPVIGDEPRLRESAARSRALGYDGKWVIHPSQIDVVNEVFTPTSDEIERALEVVRSYEKATKGGGRGAARLGDLMVDEASRKVADRMLSRARAAGLLP